jgi:hypothetical protein
MSARRIRRKALTRIGTFISEESLTLMASLLSINAGLTR